MLPNLFQKVKPVPSQTEASIGELVSFTQDAIPRQIWIDEFGHQAPKNVVERHEHHYHLHYNDYRQLTQHVENVVEWENAWPVIYWPCRCSFMLAVGFFGLMFMVWATLELMIWAF